MFEKLENSEIDIENFKFNLLFKGEVSLIFKYL
jgi:hypothetical protein